MIKSNMMWVTRGCSYESSDNDIATVIYYNDNEDRYNGIPTKIVVIKI